MDTYLNAAANGLLTGLVYGLMALGLSVIFGVVRIVNFAHGELMTIGMYIAWVLFTALNLDPLATAVPIAALLFGIGYALQRWLITPFVNRSEHSQFILMLAVALILSNGLMLMFGPDGRAVQPAYAYDSFAIGTLVVDATKVYAGSAALLAALGLFVFFKATLVGKAIRACADNHTGSLVVGLEVKHLYALTFGIGTACVGTAGSVLVLLLDVAPQIGASYTLLGFVVVITGGLGSMPGALMAGILVGVTEAFAGMMFAPSAKALFVFAILIATLLFRPHGLMGRRIAT